MPATNIERTPIHDAVDAAGNHPLKLLTLVALAQDVETPLSRSELGHAVDDLQDSDNPGWRLDGTPALGQPYALCTSALLPAGLVAFTTKHVRSRREPVEACMLTEKGVEAGLPVAGAFLNFELDHEHSLLELLGASGGVSGGRAFHFTRRLAVYELLLQHPSAQLYREGFTDAGIPYDMILRMSLQGIIETKGKFFDFGRRQVTLTAPPAEAIGNNFQGVYELRLVAAALAAMYDAGKPRFTGGDLIRHVTEQDPSVNIPRLRKLFLAKVSEGYWPFVELQSPYTPELRKKRYSLSPQYHESVADILIAYRRLLGSAKERDAYHQQALGFLQPESRADVSVIMGRAQGKSPNIHTTSAREWETLIPQFTPPEGISVRGLYDRIAQATGKRITYRSFRAVVSNTTTVQIDYRYDTASGKHGTSFVTSRLDYRPPPWPAAGELGVSEDYRLSGHGKGWRQFGACLEEDPDLFFAPNPHSNSPDSPDIVTAKQICAGCEVKGDCLLFALETGESHAVAGAFTPRERQRLTPGVLEWLRQSGRPNKAQA